MRKRSTRHGLNNGGLARRIAVAAAAALSVCALVRRARPGAGCGEARSIRRFEREFREPVTLASKDGVLEVRLTARQGEAMLDTVADAGEELPAVRLRGDPRHAIRMGRCRAATSIPLRPCRCFPARR